MVTASLPDEWSPLVSDVQRAYPREGCGLVVRLGQTLRVIPMRNAYDDFHAREPEKFPRTAATAYQFDSQEWLRMYQEMDARGEALVAVYHSHADVGCYFSEEDQRMATFDGQPLLPGASYIVVAVDKGQVTEVKLFAWRASEFVDTGRAPEAIFQFLLK